MTHFLKLPLSVTLACLALSLTACPTTQPGPSDTDDTGISLDTSPADTWDIGKVDSEPAKDTSDGGDGDVTGKDTADSGPGDIDVGPPGALDPTASTITIEGDSFPADGLTTVDVRVKLVDEKKLPVPGIEVHISTDGAKGVIVTQPLKSNGDGEAIGQLVAIDGGSISISATALVEDTWVQVGAPVSLTFTGCTTTADHYRRNLRGPVFSICTGCHRPMGLASEWGIWSIDDRLDDATVTETLATLQGLAAMKDDGLSLLLGKPSDQISHEGGLLVAQDSPAYQHLEALITRLEEGDNACTDDSPDFFTSVDLLSDASTLRRAAFKLVGRAPTEAELTSLQSGKSMQEIIQTGMLTEPAFHERLELFFNDLLLTDRVLGSFKQISHLSQADYPNRLTYRPLIDGKPQYNNPKYSCEFEPPPQQAKGVCCHATPDVDISCEVGGETVDFCTLGDNMAIYGLRRQGLALMTYVVKNDLPFSEILTADYTMVNPITMRLFRLPDGTNNVDFDDPCDLTDFKPVKLQMNVPQGVTEENTYPSHAVPHAGILSSHTFLNRYMTTPSNLNRHRASEVLWKFLDIDITSLVQFTVGQDEVMPLNPTKDGFVCSVCHAAMDPVAGSFVKWTGIGRVRRSRVSHVCTQYLPEECTSENDCGAEESCVDQVCVAPGYDPALCVRPVGFAGEQLEGLHERAPLRWMAQRLAASPRFPRAMVKHLFTVLTDRDWITAPTQRDHPGYAGTARAYVAQEAELERVTAIFVAAKLNLKAAIAEIIVSPWFRAAQSTSDAPYTSGHLAGQVGGGRLLTPMMLNDKIKILTGFPWIMIQGRSDTLLSGTEGYRVLYGGIDSKSIVTRARDPFAVASAVARRMSLEMACLVVPQDLAWIDPTKRDFFEAITPTTVPENEAGEKMNQAAIDATIAQLHLSLLNEPAPPGSSAYEETYALLVKVWNEGKARVVAQQEPQTLPSPCRADTDIFTKVEFKNDPDRKNVQTDPQYVIRSWMAVMSYLLSDARFLMTVGGE